MEIKTVIWLCAVGISIGIIAVYYNSRFLGRFVRALIDIDATSPETAMSIEELGLKLTPAIKSSLRPGSDFSQTVLKTEDNRYYIAPDKLSLAKSKYRGRDINLVFVIVIISVVLLFALACTYLLPEALEKLSQFFSGLFSERF